MLLTSSTSSVETMRAEIGRRPPIKKNPVLIGLPRPVEVFIALLALLLASPLIALVAFAIAFTDGRPIFFRQKRVGQFGRVFEMFKIRTMNASDVGPQITSDKDPRITRLGRFLRDSKLDELPTFWNVLRGDMSLVGPRPEVPRFVTLNDPAWRRILAVKPGITDPVTVSLRSESEMLAGVEGDTELYYVRELQPKKLKGYLSYLERRNWRTDLSVLWQTLVAIIH
jgi:lipopolysaccharide/colanic/teichoic acid biosynthesis glycosyltransferase